MNKNLYNISWQVKETTYREDKALSYSNLSTFNREGFSKLDSLFDPISGPSLTFGSMVDILLTEGLDVYNDTFMVAEIPVLTASRLDIAEELFNTYKDQHKLLESIGKESILAVADKVNFQTNWNNNTRVKKIIEECSDYYNLMVQAKDKIIVSREDHQAAIDCVQALRNSKATSHFFTPPLFSNIENFYQLKFLGKYEDIEVKCMLDLCVVDHENKIIVPVDIKTTFYPEAEFPKAFLKWNYWIQAQLYWYILRQNLDNDPYFKDFELKDFTFLVVSRNHLNPLVWQYPDTKAEVDLEYGDNFKCRNWRKILKELHYYLTEKPKFPIGIKEEGSNNIIEHL